VFHQKEGFCLWGCGDRDLTAHAFTDLLRGGWLNDDMLNTFLESVVGPQAASHRQKFQNTFWFTSVLLNVLPMQSHVNSLLKDPYTGLEVQLMDLDMIFVPVNIKNLHWVLVVCNLLAQTMELYDSMGESNQYYGDLFGKARAVLQAAAVYQGMPEGSLAMANEKEFGGKDRKHVMTLQADASSCGVSVCAVTTLVSGGLLPVFHQDVSKSGPPVTGTFTKLRKRMAALMLLSSATHPSPRSAVDDSDDSEVLMRVGSRWEVQSTDGFRSRGSMRRGALTGANPTT
jgi:Ulp1 family protease